MRMIAPMKRVTVRGSFNRTRLQVTPLQFCGSPSSHGTTIKPEGLSHIPLTHQSDVRALHRLCMCPDNRRDLLWFPYHDVPFAMQAESLKKDLDSSTSPLYFHGTNWNQFQSFNTGLDEKAKRLNSIQDQEFVLGHKGDLPLLLEERCLFSNARKTNQTS
jgi:hypothetical protein